MMTAHGRACPVCDSPLSPDRPGWLLRCPQCGFLASTLQPAIETDHAESAINETGRATALEGLRQANFIRILDALQRIDPRPGKPILDVGCGHGWFLKAARERGFCPEGLEPDEEISRLAQRTGLPVRHGYFPQDVPPGAAYDVITFNDVFEHLPDVSGAMKACHDLLAPGGVLMINLPVQTGAFYRLASVLRGVGVRKPFERLWQKEFPSPHLSYFRGDHLRRLAARNGLNCEYEAPLPSVQSRGLWHRLRYDRTASRLMAGLVYGGVLMALPVLRLLPSDIRVFFFRKPAAASRAA